VTDFLHVVPITFSVFTTCAEYKTCNSTPQMHNGTAITYPFLYRDTYRDIGIYRDMTSAITYPFLYRLVLAQFGAVYFGHNIH